MPIAEEIVRRASEISAEHGDVEVVAVEVELGELRLVQPEAMREAFLAVAEGTPVEGAELVMREVAPEARCRSCGGEFRPEVGCFVCPSCGEADADITAGNDIMLLSVELRERGE